MTAIPKLVPRSSSVFDFSWPAVSSSEIVVSIDPVAEVVSLSGSGITENVIAVDPGYTVIMFALDSSGLTEKASFPTDPFNWFGGEHHQEPVDLPAAISVRREASFGCSLIDFNDGAGLERYFFRISVFYAGKLLTSEDPTVMNKPPA